MRNTVSLSLFVGLGLSVAMGCSGGSSSSEADAGPDMTIRKTCLQTECEVRMEDDSYACERCLDACFSASYDCDSSSACEHSCSSRPCSEAENECAIEGFEVTLPTNPSPEVLAACRRVRDRQSACGYEPFPESVCDLFAAIERADVAPQYDCLAALPCEAFTSEAAIASCSLSPSTVGDELCFALTKVCGESLCTQERRERLNSDGAWLRPDVINAGKSCAEQASCDDASSCFNSWLDAIEP